MRRRTLLAVPAGAAAYPLTAGAQQKAARVVGFLNGASPESYATFVAAFHSGLNDTGYTEGRNLAVEFRWAQDRPDRLAALVADLVSRDVEVLVATGGSPPLPKSYRHGDANALGVSEGGLVELTRAAAAPLCAWIACDAAQADGVVAIGTDLLGDTGLHAGDQVLLRVL